MTVVPRRAYGPFPLVVDLHGGAWICGDRLNDAVVNDCKMFARYGDELAVLEHDLIVACDTPPTGGGTWARGHFMRVALSSARRRRRRGG